VSDFVEITIPVLQPVEENSEIITAFLSEYAFNMFQTEGDVVKAYAAEGSVSDADISGLNEILRPFASGEIQQRKLEKENWNALWENNYFEPVVIGNRVRLHAQFQTSDPEVEFDITIQPKMSFGTGHHSTTQLMMQLMLDFEAEVRTNTVLDMGAGTGVLAILAEKLGATELVAIDIEDWAAANIRENAELNGCSHIREFCGDASLLRSMDKKYGVILANIHKSVLLADAKDYAQHLFPNGLLFLSGFYEHDLTDIQAEYAKNQCTYLRHEVLNQWCAAVFRKAP
jgi:ribosomal protein L11 methyltransferase